MTRMLHEIEEQPDILLRTLHSIQQQISALQSYRGGKFERVIFTGMGASFTAVYPTLLYLAEHGISASLVEANELIYHYLPVLNPRTLLVLISQSGRSVEIVKLLEQRNPAIPIIGITNDRQSPLGTKSSIALYLDAGDEATVSSKTYTSTLAALRILACVLAGEALPFEELEQAARHIQNYLPAWHTRMDEIAKAVVKYPALHFLGRSISYASAATAALLVKESAKLPTEGMNAGQFRHGPIEMVDENTAIFIFAGQPPSSELNVKLAADVTALGAKVILIGEQPHFQVQIPDTSLWTLPLVEIVPMQLLAAKLAAERGFEPGKFRYIQKVTTHE